MTEYNWEWRYSNGHALPTKGKLFAANFIEAAHKALAEEPNILSTDMTNASFKNDIAIFKFCNSRNNGIVRKKLKIWPVESGE